MQARLDRTALRSTMTKSAEKVKLGFLCRSNPETYCENESCLKIQLSIHHLAVPHLLQLALGSKRWPAKRELLPTARREEFSLYAWSKNLARR